jgi:hypothetical protein
MPSFRPAHLRTCVAIVGVCILGSSLCANTPPPSHVQGLHRAGLGARQVRVSVRDDQGRVRPEMQPGIAVIKNARWSPNDAERDGASEFEVLLSAARLLEQHALPGLVGIGNQHGAFLPAAELALSRVAAMGLPVVKVSAAGSVAANDENLFIEAGTLSTEDAKSLLAECLLSFGTLPPARNVLSPTADELAAIRRQVDRYQAHFDQRSGPGIRIASR